MGRKNSDEPTGKGEVIVIQTTYEQYAHNGVVLPRGKSIHVSLDWFDTLSEKQKKFIRKL